VAGAKYPAKLGKRAIKPMVGKSLLPVFKGQEREAHEALYWQFSIAKAVRQGEWKLVRSGSKNPWALYNMENDPTEMKDLAKAHPERSAAMAQLWDNWYADCKKKP
jgi:arylsulfatase